MKKSLLAVLFAAPLALPLASSHAAGWEQLANAPDGGVHVDKSTIETFRKAWFKIEPANHRYKYMHVQKSFNCQTRTVATMQTVGYNDHNRLVSTFTDLNPAYEHIERGSNDEVMFDYVCNPVKNALMPPPVRLDSKPATSEPAKTAPVSAPAAVTPSGQ